MPTEAVGAPAAPAAVCPRCGRRFACGALRRRDDGTAMAPCWCTALPPGGPVAATPGGAPWNGCLCADCLGAVRAAEALQERR